MDTVKQRGYALVVTAEVAGRGRVGTSRESCRHGSESHVGARESRGTGARESRGHGSESHGGTGSRLNGGRTEWAVRGSSLSWLWSPPIWG